MRQGKQVTMIFRTVLILTAAILLTTPVQAAVELLVGTATANVTPERPVALQGQLHTRIAKAVDAPVMAAVLALESCEGGKPVDQAIAVSCDLAFVPNAIVEQLRKRVKDRLAGFDGMKLFVSATHTHTAPVLEEGFYEIPKEGVMQPPEYVQFLLDRVSEAVVKAWESRKPAAVSWGLGHAVVAQNRRTVYADGRAQMYGSTDRQQFRGIEGYEDHGVESLFFWNRDKKLIAAAVNVACTAQEVEGKSTLDADFWHEVRANLQERYGKDLAVLGWIGAAGDQSPHLMYRKKAEERMLTLRGLTRKQEIARRICQAVDEAYEGAQKDLHPDVRLVHKVQQLKLPVRKVTDEEMAAAKAKVESYSKARNQAMASWHQDVVDRHERQKTNPLFDVEVHVLRLGDVAICTNPFELFTDYGIQMKARSKALQTFVVQLTGWGIYLPTERAVRGGGYSAIIESNIVGPEGGQMLVERTVEQINALWPAKR